LLVFRKFISFFHVFYIYRTAKDLERYKIQRNAFEKRLLLQMYRLLEINMGDFNVENMELQKVGKFLLLSNVHTT
jgi:hypothetical protein